MPEEADETATDTPARRPPSRRIVAAVGTLLVIMVIMNWVGDALTTT